MEPNLGFYGMTSMDGGFFAIFSGLFLVFLMLFFIVGLAMYLLSAFGFYRMAIKRGIDNPWLAFIPIANTYIIGLIIGRLEIGNNKFEGQNLGLILVALSLGAGMLYWIPLLGQLIALGAMVAFIYVLYVIFDLYSDNPVLYTILGVVIPPAAAILIFIIRENEQKPKENHGVQIGAEIPTPEETF